MSQIDQNEIPIREGWTWDGTHWVNDKGQTEDDYWAEQLGTTQRDENNVPIVMPKKDWDNSSTWDEDKQVWIPAPNMFNSGDWKKNVHEMKYESTLCIYPWNCLSLGSNGNIRPCCNATNPTMYEDDEGNLANIRTTKNSSAEVLNSKTHQEIREYMLAGKQHPVCGRCWEQEAQGVPSFRHDANSRHPHDYERIYVEQTTEPLITRLELDLGTKCNLKCRMCSPFSSSLIQKEINANREKNGGAIVDYYDLHPVDKTKDFKLDEWVDVVDIKELLGPHIHNIDYIYLIGGEPLIIDAHTELLEWIIELGLAPQIKLHYNTNGITIGKKFIDMWKNFKFIQMAVSIDGYKEHYEFIRYPAAWDKIDKNFRKIFAVENVNTSISTTVQNITLERLDEFILWAEDIGSSIFFLNVDYPKMYTPWVMPKENYYEYLRKIESIKDKVKVNKLTYKDLVDRLRADGEKYFKPEYDEERQRRGAEFIQKSKVLDDIREQDLFVTHPWVKDFTKLIPVKNV